MFFLLHCWAQVSIGIAVVSDSRNIGLKKPGLWRRTRIIGFCESPPNLVRRTVEVPVLMKNASTCPRWTEPRIRVNEFTSTLLQYSLSIIRSTKPVALKRESDICERAHFMRPCAPANRSLRYKLWRHFEQKCVQGFWLIDDVPGIRNVNTRQAYESQKDNSRHPLIYKNLKVKRLVVLRI